MLVRPPTSSHIASSVWPHCTENHSLPYSTKETPRSQLYFCLRWRISPPLGAYFSCEDFVGLRSSCQLPPPRNRFRSRLVSVSSETGARKCWHSVLIHCDAAEDGSLRVKVIACHFDWDESRQIALIQSDPTSKEASFDHS